jgi:TIR domain
MAIPQTTLRSKAASYAVLSESMKVANSKQLSTKKSAFLCHSHKDEDLVKGLIILFQEQGIDLYVDWKDHTMPETPNGQTAKNIQSRIRQSDLFLFLASANSKQSRWCPWEIGYADSSQKRIYILPTSDGTSSYGNEYLELYPHIDIGKSKENNQTGYAVFQPGNTNGTWLSSSVL